MAIDMSKVAKPKMNWEVLKQFERRIEEGLMERKGTYDIPSRELSDGLYYMTVANKEIGTKVTLFVRGEIGNTKKVYHLNRKCLLIIYRGLSQLEVVCDDYMG